MGRMSGVAVRRVSRRHRLAAWPAGAGGRSFLRRSGRQSPRACRASRLPAGRADGGADRRQRAPAAHNRAAVWAGANRRARHGKHRRAGEGGNPGTDPGPRIPSRLGQHSTPPATAGRLVTARATHDRPAAGRRRASSAARTRPSAYIPPGDRGWQRQCSNGEAAPDPKTGHRPPDRRGWRPRSTAAGPRGSGMPSDAVHGPVPPIRSASAGVCPAPRPGRAGPACSPDPALRKITSPRPGRQDSLHREAMARAARSATCASAYGYPPATGSRVGAPAPSRRPDRRRSPRRC
jgi:hypothetical protein